MYAHPRRSLAIDPEQQAEDHGCSQREGNFASIDIHLKNARATCVVVLSLVPPLARELQQHCKKDYRCPELALRNQ